MDTETIHSLTPKGIQTRQHILNTAIHLFATRGYDATTMREIAFEAGCSPGLAYRYFTRKEELVMAHFEQLAYETAQQIQRLPEGKIADRFHQAMLDKLEQVSPYREAIGAMFGAGMNPKSDVSILGTSAAPVRDALTMAFYQMVIGSKDSLKEQQAQQLATILYSLHLLVLLFWLYDRTPNNRATYDLLDMAREAFKVLRPALILPFVDKMIEKLALTLGAVLGGA